MRRAHAESTCGIDDDGIKKLNLIELYVSHNYKIKDVSYMTNLRTLIACGNCGIDKKGINNLKFIELNTYGNKNFK